MQDDLETPTPTPTTDTTSAQPTVSEAPRRAGRGMLSTVLWVVAILVLMAATGYGVYMWQHKKVTDLNTKVSSLNAQVTNLNAKVDKLTKTQASNNSNSSTSTTSGDTTALKAYTAAQLFEKCQMNDATAAGSWQDSPAHVQYADLSGRGGETDAFVYATLPGTAGNTQACVFMVKDGTLTQLWRLPENNFLAQSTIKLNDQNQIVYTGYQANTTTQNTIIYTWSSSQGTFVRQP